LKGLVLNPHQAFQPGSDLWVIGSPEKASWALKIDWLLHFQFIKARKLARPAESFPQHILNMPSQEGSPSLVVAENYLPCRWVISIETPSISAIKKAAQGLKAQKIRVFLADFESNLQQEFKTKLIETFHWVEFLEDFKPES
jgi:hypothetical protein